MFFLPIVHRVLLEPTIDMSYDTPASNMYISQRLPTKKKKKNLHKIVPSLLIDNLTFLKVELILINIFAIFFAK